MDASSKRADEKNVVFDMTEEDKKEYSCERIKSAYVLKILTFFFISASWYRFLKYH